MSRKCTGHRSSVIRQYYRFNGLTIQRFNKLQINLFNFSTIQQFNFSTEIIGSTIVRFNGLTKKNTFSVPCFPFSENEIPRHFVSLGMTKEIPRRCAFLGMTYDCHSERFVIPNEESQ